MDEVFSVSVQKNLAETGGGHNQKGVEFQRHWALSRMFELESAGTPDFLFLFESVQDVAELDSATAPSSIKIYQVKKKDRGEWSWALLTNLHDPGKKKTKPLVDIKNSPLGKLYASVLAFKKLKSSGHFVSNNGCALPLKGGGEAATALTCDLSKLDDEHLDLLKKGLEQLHAAGGDAPDPSKIQVKKVSIPPDAPGTQLVGIAVEFLSSRSPRHAGQARALVDALLAQVSPLGAKTASCAIHGNADYAVAVTALDTWGVPFALRFSAIEAFPNCSASGSARRRSRTSLIPAPRCRYIVPHELRRFFRGIKLGG